MPTCFIIDDEPSIRHAAPQAAQVELSDVLKNGWIEFWYEPKVDLRRKQLAGAEAFARCRHPQSGILLPAAFMPGATDADLTLLSELVLASALRGDERLARLGLNTRFITTMVEMRAFPGYGFRARRSEPARNDRRGIFVSCLVSPDS